MRRAHPSGTCIEAEVDFGVVSDKTEAHRVLETMQAYPILTGVKNRGQQY